MKSSSDINSCHVLFISSSEKIIIKTILKKVDNNPILTVSDINGFSEQGGSIEFYVEENKIRFAINMRTLKETDIKVSSKLLRLAKVINPL